MKLAIQIKDVTAWEQHASEEKKGVKEEITTSSQNSLAKQRLEKGYWTPGISKYLTKEELSKLFSSTS